MADTNITIPELGSLTAGQVSDLLLVTRGTTGYKMLVSDIAKTIIETYQGSSLAGSAQSVKSALDSLNSRSGVVLRKSVTIERIVIGESGYTSISDYYPGAQAGYMFLHAYLANYNSSSIKVAFTITGNGDYIYGTPNTAISNMTIHYLYVPTVRT